MAYTKTNWENGITPINEDNLNKIEDELELLDDNVPIYGSNANGSYVKYGNGVMICYKTVSGTSDITETWGNGYTTGSSNTISLGDFAETFISTPVVNITVGRGNFNCWLATVQGTTTTFAGYVSLLRFTTQPNVSYTLNIIAIGRWKQ